MEIRRVFGALDARAMFFGCEKKCEIKNILSEVWSFGAVKSWGTASGCRNDFSQGGSKRDSKHWQSAIRFVKQFPQIQFPQLLFLNNYKVRGSTPINFEIQVNYKLPVLVNNSPGLFPTLTPALHLKFWVVCVGRERSAKLFLFITLRCASRTTQSVIKLFEAFTFSLHGTAAQSDEKSFKPADHWAREGEREKSSSSHIFMTENFFLLFHSQRNAETSENNCRDRIY